MINALLIAVYKYGRRGYGSASHYTDGSDEDDGIYRGAS